MVLSGVLRLSLVACLKNILPIILWTLCLCPLAVAALIPCGLGFLVLMPVMLLGMYVSYRQIFLDAS